MKKTSTPRLTGRELVTRQQGNLSGPILLGVIVATPFTLSVSAAGKDYQVGLFFPYLLLFFYLFCLRIFLYRRTSIPRNRSTMLVFLLIFSNAVAWCIAALAGYATMSGFFSLIYWICLISFYFVGVVVVGSEQRLRLFILTVVTVTSLCSMFAIYYWLTRIGGGYFGAANVVDTREALREVISSWPNYYGVFLSSNLTLIICIMLYRKNVLRLGRLMGLSLPIAGALLLTASVGAAVGLSISLLTIALLLRASRGKMVLVGAVALLVIASFVFVPATLQRARTMFQRGPDFGGKRIAFIKLGIQTWLRSPLVGMGFQTYSDLVPDFYLRLSRTTEYVKVSEFRHGRSSIEYVKTGSAHNEYVTILLKSGLLGLVPFLIVVVYVLKKSVHSFHMLYFPASKDIILGMIAVISLLSVTGLAIDTFHFFQASALFWVYMGALSRLTQKRLTGNSQLSSVRPVAERIRGQ